MIVTCPSCSSKYRVRDEAVPPEGAELQCPSCSSVFVAHPPPRADSDNVAAALDKMTRAREAAELRVLELEKQLVAARAGTDELVRRTENKDVDVARAREDMARAEARANSAEASIRRLTDELSRARNIAGDQAELLSVKQQLFEAQRRQRTISADLDVANALVHSLQTDVSVLRAGNSPAAQSDASRRIAALQTEIESLRAQSSMVEVSSSSSSSSSSAAASAAQAMIAAIGPMLWGLEQTVSYLEQFAGNEPMLASHVKQLRLLQKVLARLAET